MYLRVAIRRSGGHHPQVNFLQVALHVPQHGGKGKGAVSTILVTTETERETGSVSSPLRAVDSVKQIEKDISAI